MTAIFPLGTAYLPGDRVLLRVFEDRYRKLFSDLLSARQEDFATVLIERGHEVGGGDRRFDHGVMVHIDGVGMTDGQLLVEGTATSPVTVTSWDGDDPYPSATVAPCAWDTMDARARRDVAAAVSVLAQSLRSLLARHGVAADEAGHPLMSSLVTVASGQWQGPDPLQEEVVRAFWIVARAVPCGPLDRHRFLRETTGSGAVRLLRGVIEHTDEILAFGMRDER